ncbi:recombinase family protein [Pasteurella skyensis]|uniref:recombinase family protein n=1 Tax=Phocoenobacter skyensis TaxID=97481 RepID=UPI0027567255|nr:recombinase family protein [Pasteurella skyensis]MDP8189054.1 recombinase family protein [Pasteurella skyensis]
MALIGFARVSTRDQDLTKQIIQLKEAGCSKIFEGKNSGKQDTNAQRLSELLDYIREGDTVVVTKFDRLGRSLSQCLNTLEYFKQNNIGFIALDKSIDTNKKSDPMSMALVHLLGLFAELERSFIVERTQEGKRAKIAAGNLSAKGGRPPKITTEIRKQIIDDFKKGLSIADIANKYKLGRSTIAKLRGEYRRKLHNT